MGALRIACGVLCFVILVKAESLKPFPANSGSSLNAFTKFYKHCENSEDLFRCVKQQALKLVNRALKLNSIKVMDGVSLSKREDTGRSLNDLNLPETDEQMRSLSSDAVDSALIAGASRALSSFQLQLNLPKVFEFVQYESEPEFEEGRKKRKKYLGPFLAAMAIKAGVLKLAYHSIAIVAAKALSKYSVEIFGVFSK